MYDWLIFFFLRINFNHQCLPPPSSRKFGAQMTKVALLPKLYIDGLSETSSIDILDKNICQIQGQ